MRHTPCQAADRLQLLRLHQPGFHLQPPGYVAGHSKYFAHLPLLILQQRDCNFSPYDRPVLMYLIDLVYLCAHGLVVHCKGCQHFRKTIGGVLVGFRGERKPHILTQDFFRGISEQVLYGRADIRVLAGTQIHQPDHVSRILRDQSIAFLGGTKGRLGSLTFGDVRTGTTESREFAAVVENRNSIGRYPNHPAVPGAHFVLEIEEWFPARQEARVPRF